MTVFWISAIVLTLLTLVVILYPLWRQKRSDDVDQAKLNLALYEDRVEELKNEHAAGAISDDELAQLSAEAKKALLNDVDPEELKRQGMAAQGRRAPLVVVTFIVVVGLSVVLYKKIGAYDQVQQAQWLTQTQHEMSGQGDMDSMLATLESRLAENPDNVDGWLLLARSYMQIKRYDKAAMAWKQLAAAMKKAGEDHAPALGLHAQALFLSGASRDAVMQAANEALAADPEEVYTLGLLGGMAMQSGEFTKAIEYWQRVRAKETDPAQIQAIDQSIAQAREMAVKAGQLSEADLPKAPESSAGAALKVRVDIPANLKANLTGNETLFVLARPVGGRMPLAVVRKTVGDLPLEVTLDDSMAMGPMAKLSTVPEVEVVAKVSRSGTPQSQPGDLEVVAGPIKVAETKAPITISIDKVVQ
ncbi:MAG: c-type cytochrome biogenesis protein CcmI [Gammaproteobacteria bacterium]|nr:MAG: c-type cytochrome biogenesis protein CcmI [Gammaproteobacteria bacterium]